MSAWGSLLVFLSVGTGFWVLLDDSWSPLLKVVLAVHPVVAVVATAWVLWFTIRNLRAERGLRSWWNLGVIPGAIAAAFTLSVGLLPTWMDSTAWLVFGGLVLVASVLLRLRQALETGDGSAGDRRASLTGILIWGIWLPVAATGWIPLLFFQDRNIVTVLGGGFVNTELRELAEPRVFDYFDYVTLDDGERPLLALLEHLRGERPRQQLVRSFLRVDGEVSYINAAAPDIPFAEAGTPTWDGLPLDRYLSLLDMLNPMHRLWSDARWNKLTVAHGCYWKKCSFCDVSLDYISRYEALAAATLVDRIEAIVAETGQTGFHFVDEAAPPKALKALAEELRTRKRSISWWGNIRFEKSFTPELCAELAASGCIAVSGGLEVASDRLLKLMQKGVSVDQVARVTHAFSEAGILVHAYLMYGFPTQTVQDTVDALEYVRQLFAAGCIQSGFFHRFACSVHAPVGLHPERYGVTLKPLRAGRFAKNDVGFIDPTGVDHDVLGQALNKALYNYMHGIGLEQDVRGWFAGRVPKTTVPRNFISRALRG
jgi:hypothetical protein